MAFLDEVQNTNTKTTPQGFGNFLNSVVDTPAQPISVPTPAQPTVAPLPLNTTQVTKRASELVKQNPTVFGEVYNFGENVAGTIKKTVLAIPSYVESAYHNPAVATQGFGSALLHGLGSIESTTNSILRVEGKGIDKVTSMLLSTLSGKNVVFKGGGNVVNIFNKEANIIDSVNSRPKTEGQKKAYVIGGVMGVVIQYAAVQDIVERSVAGAVATIGEYLPIVAKGAEAVSKAELLHKWSLGYISKVVKSGAIGIVTSLIIDHKQEMFKHALETGGIFSALSFLTYPVATFFKPILKSVGEMDIKNNNLKKLLQNKDVVEKPISKTLLFRNPNDSTQLLMVTPKGASIIDSSKGNLKSLGISGNNIPQLDSIHVEAFKENPSPFKWLKDWTAGKLKIGDKIDFNEKYANAVPGEVVNNPTTPETAPPTPEDLTKQAQDIVAKGGTKNEAILHVADTVGVDQATKIVDNAVKSVGMATANINNSKKVIRAFNKSTDKKTVGNFQLGSFGTNNIERKVSSNDRFPIGQLADTQKHIIGEYRASNNPNSYRIDNTAWVSKMPDGELRVIYTRKNADGFNEIINAHKITNTKYIDTLKSFGTPDQSRTGIVSLEAKKPNPLADGSTSIVSKQKSIVKRNIENSVVQVVNNKTGEKYFQTIKKGELTQFINKIDNTSTGIAGTQMSNGDIYHLTAKTPQSMLDNGFKDNGIANIKDIPNNTRPITPQVDALQKKLAEMNDQLDYTRGVVSDMPGKGLVKYVSKETGQLPELGAKTTANKNKSTSVFAKKGDIISQEILGQNVSSGGDVTVAQEHVDAYIHERNNLKELEAEYKKLKKQLRELKTKKPTKAGKSAYDEYLSLTNSKIANLEQKISKSLTIEEARKISESIPETYKIHTIGREKLRAKILDELYGTGAKIKDRRADIVLGLPAGGKSSAVANPLAKEHGSLIIDSDMAKELLPEYRNGLGARATHQESSDIAGNILKKAVENKDNVVLPLVGRNKDKMQKLVEDLYSYGYTVHLHFNEVSVETAKKRAISRFNETGRFVDTKYIESLGLQPKETYDILKTYETDTSKGNERSSQGIQKTSKGQSVSGNTTRGRSPGLLELGKGKIASYTHYNNEVAKGEKPKIVEKSTNISKQFTPYETEALKYKSAVYFVDRKQNQFFNELNKIEEKQKKVNATQVSGRSRATVIRTNIELDNLAKQHDRISTALTNIKSLEDTWNKAYAKSKSSLPVGLDEEIKILRGTKGMTAEDIMKTYPNIQLKRDVPAKDIHGNKIEIPKGEELTPYELKGNKILLQDGGTYIVSKNQFQNIESNAIVGEAKPFAPELKGTVETIKTEKPNSNSQDKKTELELQAAQAMDAGNIQLANKYLEQSKNVDKLFGKTKYSQYTLPNGKNYKEILIKAPVNMSDAKDIVRPDGSIIKNVISSKNTFTSSHWDEKNVLSHLRVNERTYKGEPVTFMEELQSDWNKALRSGETTANHPILKNWQEWSIKRALLEAVANKSKYFAWINGAQTSARYNLATHIDKVEWYKAYPGLLTDTTLNIDLNIKGGDKKIIKIDKNGTILEEGSSVPSNWVGKKLNEVLGKGLADKIMAKDSGTLSGAGLKFGGEWADSLYNRQVPNIVKDLTGADVIKMDMGLPISSKQEILYTTEPHGNSRITKGQLTESNLKVGEYIKNESGDEYIITDVIGGGKFKAVKTHIYETAKEKGIWNRISKIDTLQDFIKRNEHTFDISNPKTIQQGIELTPAVVSKIKGEALQIQTSGEKFKPAEAKPPTLMAPDINTTGNGIVVKVKSFGKEGYVPVLETYKGMKIVQTGNTVSVWNPTKGTLFQVGVDDSKDSGIRTLNESANNVESARKYIDYIQKNNNSAEVKLPELPQPAKPILGVAFPGADYVSTFIEKDIIDTFKNQKQALKNIWKAVKSPFIEESDTTKKASAISSSHIMDAEKYSSASWKVAEASRTWWEKVPSETRINIIDNIDRGKLSPKDFMKDYFAGTSQELANAYSKMAHAYRERMNKSFAFESNAGIKVHYITNYFPHMWDNVEKAKLVFERYSKSMPKGRFTRVRFITFIKTGYKHGLTLKTTNLEELITMREVDGYRIAQNIEIMKEFEDIGLAFPEDTRGHHDYHPVETPDGNHLIVPPEVYTILNNSMFAQNMWSQTGVMPFIFKNLMRLKGIFVPIKLAVSGFHLIHITFIATSDARKEVYKRILRGSMSGGEAIKELAKATSFVSQATAIRKYGVGTAGWKGFYQADVARWWDTPMDKLQPYQRQVIQYIIDGGGTPKMSEEYLIRARDGLRKAVREGNYIGATIRGIPKIMEGYQKPIFESYIPALKVASYLQSVDELLKRKPELATDNVARRIAFRELWKSVDNRFGQMNYKTLFWKPMVKQWMQVSFLSLGWNLGFVREFGGGSLDIPKLMVKGVMRKSTKDDLTDKMLFSLDYVLQAVIVGGLMTYAMTGNRPKTLQDFFFPRTGGVNPDGSPARVNTSFYTREYFSLVDHYRKQGAVGGMTSLVENKMNPVLSTMAEIYNNKDYYGYQIRDTNSPAMVQSAQFLDYMLTNALAPISVSGAIRASSVSGKKGVVLSFLGFNPAPKYIAENEIESKIYATLDKRTGGVKPLAQRIISDSKANIRTLYLQGKIKEARIALKNAIKAGYISPRGRTRFIRNLDIPSDVRAFGDLAQFKGDQQYLLSIMTEKQLQRYAGHASSKIKPLISTFSPTAKKFVHDLKSGKIRLARFKRGKQI